MDHVCFSNGEWFEGRSIPSPIRQSEKKESWYGKAPVIYVYTNQNGDRIIREVPSLPLEEERTAD
jgi:hypothetical protein